MITSRGKACGVTATLFLALTLAPNASRSAVPAAGGTAPTLQELARAVADSESRDTQTLVAALRDAGQDGLDALLALRREEPGALPALQRAEQPTTFSFVSAIAFAPPRRTVLDEAIDAVAGQRDARFSGLYWHTDMDKAKAQAAATGRPILSLRLLGRLTDDLSCANSRFFRTVLYANATVSDYLRRNYILHWESVRPVPVIEIDYGDGRKVRRTITGNSIHYVLDSRGRVIDGLPGLYGPGTFLRMLQESEALARATSELSDDQFPALVARHHRARLQATLAEKERLLAAERMPDEADGLRDTPAKGFGSDHGNIADDEGALRILAAAFTEESQLDQGSRAMMAYKNPNVAMRAALSKSIVEMPMLRMVRNLQNSVALDTARNEFELRPRLRQWFIEAAKPLDLRELNENVYAELFHTPSRDPWLGLVPPDTYAALDETEPA